MVMNESGSEHARNGYGFIVITLHTKIVVLDVASNVMAPWYEEEY